MEKVFLFAIKNTDHWEQFSNEITKIYKAEGLPDETIKILRNSRSKFWHIQHKGVTLELERYQRLLWQRP